MEVPEMAAMILMLAGFVLWLDVRGLRALHRSSRRAAVIDPPAPNLPIDELLSNAATEIAVLLDLRACWFELFPFDMQLPRIERGRIVLPSAEPGVAPWSHAGVELPVVANGLNVGRFVLEPTAATVGVVFSPSARARAIAMAGRLGAPVAAALISGDASRLRASVQPDGASRKLPDC
jgi:hypothetical protein